MQSPEQLTEVLRAAGMNVTPQRLAVIAALHGDDGHPTADVIWERVRVTMPSISLRTVYQALNDLVGLGEAQLVDVGTGQARFDPNVAGHDHFVCGRCGIVTDVHASAPARLSDPDYSGFEVVKTEIVFRGRCPLCAASPQAISV